MKTISKTFLILLLVAFLTPFVFVESAYADVYSSYKQLAARQTKNKDYRIKKYDGPSSTAVIAVHGGKIEMATSELTKSVAKKTGSDWYSFEGLKKKNNFSLHITSTNFDEPIGKKLVAKSKRTLAIHGCRGSNKVTYVGGLDKNLRAKVRAELKKAGFKVAIPPKGLGGTSPKNICNQNKINKGVQLELTYSLRQQLLNNSDLYDKYVNALSNALK